MNASVPGSTAAKPRLLDLFSGAGGCARGYMDAGFYVVGVDIDPQPNYCGDEFIQADATEVLTKFTTRWSSSADGWTLQDFAAIHSSPPCQHYSQATAHENRRAFEHKQERDYADAMGCEWMSSHEARQAVPPAYTRLIGEQLLAHLHAKASA